MDNVNDKTLVPLQNKQKAWKLSAVLDLVFLGYGSAFNDVESTLWFKL